ncbi:MAG: hypothetical protein LZF60_230054 [Nitrospira sp.]|nr:MAG: hypothetical protein LZF60_230054 [Nitrospira sp.]
MTISPGISTIAGSLMGHEFGRGGLVAVMSQEQTHPGITRRADDEGKYGAVCDGGNSLRGADGASRGGPSEAG